jgi:hypothetical protein
MISGSFSSMRIRLMTAARPVLRAAACTLLAVGGLGGAAGAQDWPDRPLSLADGRVTVGGDATLTVGTSDPGYFNFTDYERSALRLVRFDVVATVRANEHLSFLTELRAEGDSGAGHWNAGAYAAYVRVQPWTSRAFEVQAGRIPTAFGGFTRQTYGSSNLLIGYPLAYQYLTSLRADAIPRTADDLVSMRGRGWYAYYPVGAEYWEHGVPLMSVFKYDTGVLAKVGLPAARADITASLTAGTLSNPGLGDGNGRPQVAARLVARPLPGLLVGVSGASGAFIEQDVRDVLPGGAGERQYRQRAFGADAEVSRGYWLVRTELVSTAWQLPALDAPRIERPLRATAWLTEGRYKLAPGLYVAARYDRMVFNRVASSQGPIPWEAGLWRVEAGAGYSVRRNVTVKGSYQYNRREGGRETVARLAAAQVVLWF